MAYSFVAASSQYLNTQSAPIINGPVTFSIFARPNNDTAAHSTISLSQTSGGERIAVAINGTTSPKRPTQGLYTNDAGTIASVADARNVSYSASVWIHQAVTVSEAISASVAATITAFANGTVGSLSEAFLIAWAGTINQILLGARRTTGGTLGVYLDGNLAEAAIWSAVLSAGEIASLSKGFKPSRVRPQSLVFYAPVVRSLQDFRGARALTNNNAATVANHPRVY